MTPGSGQYTLPSHIRNNCFQKASETGTSNWINEFQYQFLNLTKQAVFANSVNHIFLSKIIFFTMWFLAIRPPQFVSIN
jgi:hypothetical protein